MCGGTGKDAGGLAGVTDGSREAAAVTKVQLFWIHFIFIILIIEMCVQNGTDSWLCVGRSSKASSKEGWGTEMGRGPPTCWLYNELTSSSKFITFMGRNWETHQHHYLPSLAPT